MYGAGFGLDSRELNRISHGLRIP